MIQKTLMTVETLTRTDYVAFTSYFVVFQSKVINQSCSLND